MAVRSGSFFVLHKDRRIMNVYILLMLLAIHDINVLPELLSSYFHYSKVARSNNYGN